MNRREIASLMFLAGLGLLLAAVLDQMPFGAAPTGVGQSILARAPAELGTANIVTAVVLAYRGLDTLGELTILFVAATAAGMVLGQRRADAPHDPEAGFIFRVAADLLFPFLLVVGLYIVIHGHLTPGGGFQGGALLAAAFFLPFLARPGGLFNEESAAMVEGLAGASFIVIGLAGLSADRGFLAPLLEPGTVGRLFSAGTLPLLYAAVGLKVGAELAGLLVNLFETGAAE